MPWGCFPNNNNIIINFIHADSCGLNLSTLAIVIIAGSCGAALVCCLATITTIARIVVFYIKRSRQRTVASTITNTTAEASTQLSTAYTAVGETFNNQPGFQLQNCGN